MALTDSLISYWKLDESSGTRNDSHGSNHLTDNNTVGSASGKIGNAGDFEVDNSEWLEHSDNSDLSTGDIDFSFQAWVNLESTGANRVILSKWSDTAVAYEYILFFDNAANRFAFYVGFLAVTITGVPANNLGAPSTGTWYHIIAWHSSTNEQIGIAVNDGTPDTASHTPGVTDTAMPFMIGAYGNGVSNWDGLIDEVGFWKRVLTSGERTSLYNGGAGLAYPFTGGGAVPIGAYAAASQHFIGVS